MKTTTWTVVGIAAFAALVAGCGNNVKDVCNDLDDKCPNLPVDQCIDNGNTLAQTADDKGCSDAFNTYLDCVAGAGCNWPTACQSDHDAVEKCTGAFPQQ